MDIGGLARAAVAGDENALDMFTSLNRGSKFDAAGGASTGSNGAGVGLSAGLPAENLNCYAGSGSGIIYYLNDNGYSKIDYVV